ncbi:MAG: hypothetical protein M3Z66_10755 [Chloroflexota bacterium]|nr:hypothetical protein [Chloroflexota bacterium]
MDFAGQEPNVQIRIVLGPRFGRLLMAGTLLTALVGGVAALRRGPTSFTR